MTISCKPTYACVGLLLSDDGQSALGGEVTIVCNLGCTVHPLFNYQVDRTTCEPDPVHPW